MVELLIRRGADPLIRDVRGKLAFERAERNGGRVEIVERLHPLSAPCAPSHGFTDGRRIVAQSSQDE